jgi:regulator of protease activity HflC (stomatin/prohibitin superfamily)
MNEFQTIVFVVLIMIGVIGLFTASCAVRILRPYERGVVFRLGRLHGDSRGPGPTLIVPGMDRLTRVDLKVTMVSAAARNVVTRDRVPVGVDAVIWLRVVDPVKAVLNIGNYRHARVRETRHGVADRSRASGPCRRRRPATRVVSDTG